MAALTCAAIEALCPYHHHYYVHVPVIPVMLQCTIVPEMFGAPRCPNWVGWLWDGGDHRIHGPWHAHPAMGLQWQGTPALPALHTQPQHMPCQPWPSHNTYQYEPTYLIMCDVDRWTRQHMVERMPHAQLLAR